MRGQPNRDLDEPSLAHSRLKLKQSHHTTIILLPQVMETIEPAQNSKEIQLPEGWCQLLITHPSYQDPLFWICTRTDNITAALARWCLPANMKSLQYFSSEVCMSRASGYYLLMYTLPPNTNRKFLTDLLSEDFYDVPQKVEIAFQFYPPEKCTICHVDRPPLPQRQCEICFQRPSWHHTQCCPEKEEAPSDGGSPTNSDPASIGY